MQSVRDRLIVKQDINADIDSRAIDWTFLQIYDPQYGARPLCRFLERRAVTEFSRLLLGGELSPLSLVRISTQFDMDINHDLLFRSERDLSDTMMDAE